MVCIYCGSETQVINSRHQKRANQVWRRRKCLNCQAVFTTIEGINTASSLSVIHANRIEPFSRDKLLLSINESLRHRKTATDDATALTQTVLGQLVAQTKDAAIKRDDIINTCLKVLEHFDKVAATHYRAFHQKTK